MFVLMQWIVLQWRCYCCVILRFGVVLCYATCVCHGCLLLAPSTTGISEFDVKAFCFNVGVSRGEATVDWLLADWRWWFIPSVSFVGFDLCSALRP